MAKAPARRKNIDTTATTPAGALSGERFASKAGRPKRRMLVMKSSHHVETAAFIDWQGIKWFARKEAMRRSRCLKKNRIRGNNMPIAFAFAFALQIDDNFPLVIIVRLTNHSAPASSFSVVTNPSYFLS